MAQPLRIAIAGLGTVGAGVVKIAQDNGDLLSARSGKDIIITAVSARSKNQDRGVDISSYDWVESATDLASRDDVDLVVELIGGSEGPAYDLVKSALENGKHVVTANKALIAHHGYEFAKIAENNKVSLNYEAAVAGGIPIIKAMREGLSANRFRAVYGILNGTCNYILTEMRETGRDFGDVLKEAQEKGYAEADPSFDIDGVDAGHKLAILTSLAFGVRPDFDTLSLTGITQITSTDIECASEFGYRIKLLGIAKSYEGKIAQSVEPCLVPLGSPLAAIEDVYNAVYTDGDFVETPLLTGLGAGQGATASAVVADIVDIARGLCVPTFSVRADKLQEAEWMDVGETSSRYYLRLTALDKPGVVADISAILRDLNISIESFLQRGRDPNQPVRLVMITHDAKHSDILAASYAIKDLESIVNDPCLIRIEEEL